jgi:membrane-associated phospholipid phosphatase
LAVGTATAPIHRRPGRQPGRSSPWKPLVKGAAVAALAGAVAVPLVRRRFKIPPAATTAAVAAGPLGLAVAQPRNRLRDAGMYALQMWAFFVGHELPYDDEKKLRSRLKVDYPLRIDRMIGGGQLPNARLQKSLAGLGRANAVDRTLAWVHWLWFFEPHASLAWILAKHPDRFARSARQMSGVYDVGCAIYYAAPTAPPWWASKHGHTDEEVRRTMVEVGEKQWGRAWNRLYSSLDGNPWAAMPSLHFAASVMAALHLAEAGPAEGAFGWTYAAALGFALVYLGEHYVTDLLAGAALVLAVRKSEPHFEPAALAVSRGLQRLERIANE